MTREEIARIIKKARASAGFTQTEAASAIGRKQQTLASWETGQSQPDANTLFQLFDFYGVSVDEAFGLKKADNFIYTPDEQELVVAYRQATADEQGAIRLILNKYTSTISAKTQRKIG